MSERRLYPEYKYSGVESLGHVPSHWQVLPIRRYIKFRNGADYKHVEVSEGGYPVIGSGGEFRRASEFMYDGESVLFGRKGTVDKPLYVNGKFWTVDTMYYTECDIRSILPRFLYYWALRLPYNYYVTSTALPSMTQTDLGSARIALPSLSEQEEIIGYLDHETSEIDGFIADQERLVALLNERRAATISQAVTKGLDLSVPMKESGVEWLGKVPESWDVIPVKYVAAVNGRIGFRGYTVLDLVEEGHGAISLSPGNMKHGRLDLTGCTYLSWDKYYESPEIQLSTGETVVVKTGSSYGKIAYVELPEGVNATLNPQVVVLKPHKSDSRYFFYSLATERIRSEFRSYPTGGATPTMTEGNIGAPKIALPDHDMQRVIADYLDYETGEIDAAIADAQEAIELSKERRATLIAAAVTGKIDVRKRIAAELGAA